MDTAPIAEMTNGIILAKFEKPQRIRDEYQTEADLENKFIADLEKQGYERIKISNDEELFANLKDKIEKLNNVTFTSSEWNHFLEEYLNPANETLVDKARKIGEDYIYDFIFDSGIIKNIKIIDKVNINNNTLQVVNQIEQQGTHKNRYDVTILVNGLPLVHIELKKRGIPLSEAFNQIHRYTKESFNFDSSLFKFVQIFVISNGTYTRYFANTVSRNKNNYEFTCQWADAKNNTIDDLEDFTATFFEKRTILEVLSKYSVFTSDDILMIMRPYQIAATERIIWKIKSSFENKQWGNNKSGGFIWHTTGSGKTLTSFKAAQIATNIDYIDKVFFVVDRKDLDHQTMKEYQKFQEDSVNGSRDTKALKNNIENDDGKIIVTTIQKLNEFIKKNPEHGVYNKQVVLIFDECHRSQFGEAQKNIRTRFKKYYQFGFTGTPIFPENSNGVQTTADIFGAQLHSYVITDAIRDQKVLKFKVDYNNVAAKFKDAETEMDEKELVRLEKEALIHPERISEITRHILKVYSAKTHRSEAYTVKQKAKQGFNAMFAVQNIDFAKTYYEEFKTQQEDIPEEKRLKIATIYSFSQNEEQGAIGEIIDEDFEPTALDLSSKEFLDNVIDDYNEMFKTNYSTDGNSFQNYYRDLSARVKSKEIDIIIVVGMFLTGFDAPTLNTLFVDKNLRYHGLIQAFSRTNRILNKIKTFGNIVCFRDLEKATKDAITLFGDKNSINIILEKSYKDYMDGFTDKETGEVVEGYISVCNELISKFPYPTKMELDRDKKEFIELFGELLKKENILKNFDEFDSSSSVISQGLMQDYKSAYVDIREEIINISKNEKKKTDVDFSDLEFQIELLKTDEVNLDYILELILKKSKANESKEDIKQDISKNIRANMGIRAKEDLILSFLDDINISKSSKNEDVIDSFYKFANKEKEKAIEKLKAENNLNDNANAYIINSLKNGYVSSKGTELDNILPPVSRRQGAREKLKQEIFMKIERLVEIFRDM